MLSHDAYLPKAVAVDKHAVEEQSGTAKEDKSVIMEQDGMNHGEDDGVGDGEGAGNGNEEGGTKRKRKKTGGRNYIKSTNMSITNHRKNGKHGVVCSECTDCVSVLVDD